MEEVFIFIYAKDGKIKALNINESKRLDSKLKDDGWKHTTTLNASTYIQYLHNECRNIIVEIKALSK